MSGETMGMIVFGCVVLCALGYVLLRSPDKAVALTKIAGCYAAPGQPIVTVSPIGYLRFGNHSIRVAGSRDKAGDALWPEQRVMIDRQDHDRLELDSSFPQLLRYDEARQTLEIPDSRGGAPMVFYRDAGACARGYRMN